MKKWVFVVFAVSILFLAGTYIFIPQTLAVSSIAHITANEKGSLRYLSDTNNWPKWWNFSPGASVANIPGSFTCSENNFKLSQAQYKSVIIAIGKGDKSFESMLSIVPLSVDSTALQWRYVVNTSSNPFKRVQDYIEARQIKGCMNKILGHLKSFLQKKENVYGIGFDRISYTDSLLISTKAVSGTYPSTSFIYALVNKLKEYAEKNGAEQVAVPIYNVTEFNKQYNVMVALPVNKVIPDAGNFAFKKMIPGSFIVTTVTGGEQSVQNALQQVHQYFEDYRLTSMAINFRMLVTDRTIEPDSSKWVTKIYQPVY